MALLTLDEAKRQLDIETTGDDLELQVYVDALTDVIERHIGPVMFRQVTETVEGRGCTMCLSSVPVTALTSVTPLGSGTALDVAGLDLDPATGIVRYLNGSFSGARWRVVYTAGRIAENGTVPPTIKLAAAILLQHLWRTQYGSARGQGGMDDFSVNEPIPGFGYAVPNRVLQLIEAYKLPPGVA
ncbi:head-tail connector protein [Streptomyces sp. BH097]|uniref:head-tail connector protein n=1 Tax=unclassified Streptomyces TaxID=2593676 RepID=UPI003BB75765